MTYPSLSPVLVYNPDLQRRLNDD
ncbi:hypothetical protein NXU91_28435 [Bacteroides ovatus]|nr:hypothetical protein [Bacteroides ovatus]MCS2301552.1 hypothetical protein [Bacteroides ovatus]